MPTAAILPIKSYSRAKHRLADAVGAPDRSELAAAMAADVLAALGVVAGVDRLVVVTAEPLAVAAAGEAGAEVVHDGAENGQSPAALLGIAAAVRRGADRVLLVPGDCPALDPAEVAALLDRPTAPNEVVIVPDRHGTGTNGLLLTPPDVLAPSFGPGSFARHAAIARAVGAAVKVAEIPSLGLDVDTPGDLDALRSALTGSAGVAERTRSVLERLLPASVLTG